MTTKTEFQETNLKNHNKCLKLLTSLHKKRQKKPSPKLEVCQHKRHCRFHHLEQLHELYLQMMAHCFSIFDDKYFFSYTGLSRKEV